MEGLVMNPYLAKLPERVLTRRQFLVGLTAATAAGAVAFTRRAGPIFEPDVFPDRYWPLSDTRGKESPVAIVRATSYDSDLVTPVKQIFELTGLDVKGKSVLLKPNLVEFSSAHPINTNPLVVLAVIEALRSRGAREVIVGEGAGHRRDTELMVEATGLGDILRREKVEFVDLNLDDVARRPMVSEFSNLPEFYFPKSILRADVVISMPKMKTHHWAGATLGMKNLYGCIPGAVYGWPKNILHWCGIPECIVDIAAALKPSFTLVDGVVAMQGDGPIHGDALQMGVLVGGADVVAVDSTCVRLMGLKPEWIPYLISSGRFLGNTDAARIAQRGEKIEGFARDFELPAKLKGLRPS
jgi:uncharacterized protein (DUF362 family)